MTDIMVFKPFRLNIDGKTIVKFAAGLNVGVPREQADHWWTRLHASPVNTKADIAVNKSSKPAVATVVKMRPARRRRAR
jgi:phosphodiesterase/alkaline phosphatase D-like protein